MPSSTNGVASKFLWKGVYQINHDNGGFTWTCWVADKMEAEARTALTELGVRIRRLLPADAELYDAVMYKWDNSRNGAFLDGTYTIAATAMTVIGAGLYGSQLAVPAVLNCDNPRSAVKLRFEDDDLFVLPRKFNLIPDIVTAGGLVTSPPANVVGRPLAAPTTDALTDLWAVQFNFFLQANVFYTVHLIGKPTQGGIYHYQVWRNAFTRKATTKKGGRVFIA